MYYNFYILYMPKCKCLFTKSVLQKAKNHSYYSINDKCKAKFAKAIFCVFYPVILAQKWQVTKFVLFT